MDCGRSYSPPSWQARNIWIGFSTTTLDPYVATDRELLDGQVQDLLAFLEALSDPAAADLTALIPASVPSGLEVDR